MPFFKKPNVLTVAALLLLVSMVGKADANPVLTEADYQSIDCLSMVKKVLRRDQPQSSEEIDNIATYPEIKVDIPVSSKDAPDLIWRKCYEIIESSFKHLILKEIKQLSKEIDTQDNQRLNNNNRPIVYNILNPSLFELSASRIASYLFPKYFGRYEFFPSQDAPSVRAGHLLKSSVQDCTSAYKPEGLEEVYAVAFYLGLEVRSPFCRVEEDKQYLFLYDFSLALWKA